MMMDVNYMKNLVEAVLVRLDEKSREGDNINEIKACILILSDAIRVCHGGQMAGFLEVFTSLYRKPTGNSLESFIEGRIAEMKRKVFMEITTPSDNMQNVHIQRHWEYELRDELGFNIQYKDRLYRPWNDNKFGGQPGNVLDAFFRKFTPDYVIGKLTEEINNEDGDDMKRLKAQLGMNTGLVGLCAGELLHEDSSAEEIKRVFVCDNDDMAEYRTFTKIKEDGVKKLLIKMEILVKN